MARTRKQFYELAAGIGSFLVGLVLIGNFVPKNLVVGGLGVLLVILGVFLVGLVVADKK